jgi:hypothetical protein
MFLVLIDNILNMVVLAACLFLQVLLMLTNQISVWDLLKNFCMGINLKVSADINFKYFGERDVSQVTSVC